MEILPVTALHFYNDKKIIVGSGKCVQMYDIEEYTPCSEPVKIINGRGIIHQISKSTPYNDNIIVVAGRELLEVAFNDSFKVINGSLLDDRIVYACFDEHLDHYVVILSHGQVIFLDKCTLRILRKYTLKEDYLLYSAIRIPNGDGKLRFAYGTVFNGIEVIEVVNDDLLVCQRLLGHEGSIFGISTNQDGRLLASVSDDRTVRLWSLRGGDDEDPDKYQSFRIMHGHRSRVWRVLIDNGKIISSSEDSTIRVWSFEGTCERVLEGHIGLNIWSISVRNNILISGGDDCSVRCWDLLHQKIISAMDLSFPIGIEPKSFEIVSLTEMLTLFSDGTVICDDLELKPPPEKLKGYSLISRCTDFVVYGTLKGTIIIQKGGMLKEFELGFSSKIAYLSSHKPYVNQSLFLILVQSGARDTLILVIDDKFCLQRKEASSLNATAICCDFYDDREECLLVGTRDGRLFFIDLFFLNVDIFEVRGSSIRSISKDALTCIIRQDFSSYLITCRDGSLYSISKSTKAIEWDKPCSSGWLEQCHLTESGKTCLAGFEGDTFFLSIYPDQSIHLSSPIELVRIVTGGAHRFWKLQFFNDQFVFCYIRLGRIYRVIGKLEGKMPMIEVRPAFQGAVIRAFVKIQEFFVTGGEDGQIVLFELENVIGRYSVSRSSGIKSLCSRGDFVFAAGSGEYLACWKLAFRKLSLLSQAPKVSSVKEARIMDINVKDELIIAAYSDSFIRLWRFDNVHFYLICEIEAHYGHCVLKCLFIKDDLVISGATDGNLVLCKILNGQLQLLHKLKVHQSGINSLSLNGNLVASGGDDGMVSITMIVNENELINICNVPKAHYSTVTALQWDSPSELSSTSIDQRIERWSYKSGSLYHSYTIRSSVPDANCLVDGWVSGMGLAYYHFK